MRDAQLMTDAAHRRDWVGSVLDHSGRVATVAVATAWAVVLASMARHRIYVSHDTLISYAHVWYVSERLWHGHGLPLHMSVLSSGHALAFPYGLVPWMTAALLRPLAGDWIVTLWLIVGTVGLIAATFWAFPELRRGWWAAGVMLNPALVSSPVIGQLPFVWAGAMLVVAIGAWRRGKRALAVVAAILAQVTHPAIVFPLSVAVVLARLRWEPDRRGLLRSYALTLPFVGAALAMTFASPVFRDIPLSTQLSTFIGTIAPRCLVVVVPVTLLLVRKARRRGAEIGMAALLIAANIGMGPSLGMPWAWGALKRTPDRRMEQFTSSPAFVPGAVYRVLRIADGKVAMYQTLRAGGRLDSEFFPESIARRSWPDTASYSRFLRGRHVDFVMIWRGYDRRYTTDEHALLERMADGSECNPQVVEVRLHQRTADYDLYRVRRSCS